MLHAGGDERPRVGVPVDPEDLAFVPRVGGEQLLLLPVVDGDGVVPVLPHARQVPPTRREAQRHHRVAVEPLQNRNRRAIVRRPHHDLGLAPDFAGGEGGFIRVPSHAQDVIRVALGDVVALGVVRDVLLRLVDGVVHHAERGGVVHQLPRGVVEGILPRVVAAVAVRPGELQL